MHLLFDLMQKMGFVILPLFPPPPPALSLLSVFYLFPSITLLAGWDLCSVLIHSHNAHCLATTNQPSYFWRGPPANQESCAITFSALQSYWRLRTNGVGPEHWDEQNRSALRFWPHQCWCLEGCVNSLRLDQSDSLALVLLSSLQVRLPLSIKKFPGTLAMKCPV